METNDKVFSRERLAGYDPELMNRSTVLIVGSGALGQNTAMNLALSGVGEIRIVDKDVFEEHNRTRSPAFPLPEEEIRYGRDKARAVAGKLRRLMTAPKPVMRYAHNWIQEIGDGAFQGVSVVVSCVDSQLARAYLSDQVRLHQLPFIEGGFAAEQIRLSSFPAPSPEDIPTQPCWRCSNPSVEGSFSCREYARLAEAAGIIPAIQNAAAVLGGLQAEAAILALHGELPPIGRSLNWNVRTWRGQSVELTTDAMCPGIHEVSLAEPIRLKTTADDSVANLLEEIGEHLGSPARLFLRPKSYLKLFWTTPCTNPSCRKIANVRSPEWRWKMDPRCSDCGGPFKPVSSSNGQTSPYAVPELSLHSNPEVLEVSCRTIGLPPLCIVRAAATEPSQAKFDNHAPVALFELPGSLEELYQSGDTNDSTTTND